MAEPLAKYNEMRRFDRTPEPEGVARPSGDTLSFVVQKHDATRMHYDFRLEHEGVLWSWAIPQGPTYDPDVKRLAVHVEDHPVSYGDFEGVIPADQYGGGTVIVWDRGTWTPREDAATGLAKGHLSFDLHGERLHGHWHLVKVKPRGDESGDPWLLFKAKDGLQSKDVDVTGTFLTSVLSGRTMEQVAAEPHRVWRSGKGIVGPVDPSDVPEAVPAELPRFVEPMLCESVDRPPDGDDWIHEIKVDGYRLQARIDGDEVRFLTRTGLDWTARFGKLAEALADLPVNSALIDGELVVFRPDGGSDFSLLQTALSENDQAAMRFVVFDLLHVEGHDLRDAPLSRRKALLRALVEAAPAAVRASVQYLDHLVGHGPLIYDQTARLGLEGVISKDADAPYRSGRSDRWRKSKHLRRQEFVVIGYTDLEGGGKGMGALAMGGWENGVLRPVGKVGTGFSDAQRIEFQAALSTVRRDDPAAVLEPDAPERKDAIHWTEPLLVAEVAYTGWTHEDRIRHPVFVGLRKDRDPSTVSRRPEVALVELLEPGERGRQALSRIKITTPERVLWPDVGVTKAELLTYWAAFGSYTHGDGLLEELGSRPLSIVRCPQGITGQQFFQKHAEKGVPDMVRHVMVPEEGTEPFLYVDSLEAILALAQLNAIEFHPWGATTDAPLAPDRVIFDLDPPEGAPWGRVAEAAFWLREALDELGFASLPRTTGGKGLHVVVPVVPDRPWRVARAFARGVAERLVKKHGNRLTLSHAKEGRRGRLYIDVLRNGLGATAVGSWSPRARPGAPVAVPIRWDEVVAVGGGGRFNVRNVHQRLKHLDGPAWVAEPAISITDEMLRGLGIDPSEITP